MVSSVLRRQKRTWVFGLSLVVGLMVGLVAYSPELYRIFCDVTGYGGGTQRVATQSDVASKAAVANTDSENILPEVTVYFDANTDKRLPWRFKPEQRKVTVRVGETKQIFYRAHNLSSDTIVGQATFNVTPFQAGSYFFKAECFCFNEQLLKPGQEARMPVVFYLEEAMLEDNEVKDIRDVTLSYTFYRLKDLESEGIEVDHSDHMKKAEGHGDGEAHGGHGDGESHEGHGDGEAHEGHDDRAGHEIDNLSETGRKRQESIESGEEQNFTPAGVRKL